VADGSRTHLPQAVLRMRVGYEDQYETVIDPKSVSLTESGHG